MDSLPAQKSIYYWFQILKQGLKPYKICIPLIRLQAQSKTSAGKINTSIASSLSSREVIWWSSFRRCCSFSRIHWISLASVKLRPIFSASNFTWFIISSFSKVLGDPVSWEMGFEVTLPFLFGREGSCAQWSEVESRIRLDCAEFASALRALLCEGCFSILLCRNGSPSLIIIPAITPDNNPANNGNGLNFIVQQQ